MNIQEYLLTTAMEECGELIKVLSKCSRFGMNSEYDGRSNLERVLAEFSDLYGVMCLLKENGIIDRIYDPTMVQAKKEKVMKFANLAAGMGTRSDLENFGKEGAD